jgi:hypothetical protein
MRQFLRKGLIGSGLLLMASSGNAQVREHDRFPMERVMSDLNRAESNSRLDRGDRKRFDRARQEVAQFERKWSNGRYDRRELDQAIDSVQRVVDARSVNYRDRAALIDDLNRMREFRARSSAPYSYGYRP